MLYVTTRNQQDAFTANHVLTLNRGVDDGLFVPLHFPKLSSQEWKKFSEMSFGQSVAEMLNMFFGVKLTGWDIDFSIGRYPTRLEPLAHRIMMSETWHNPQWQYFRIENCIRELLHTDVSLPGNWVSIAIRMAVLAGMLGHCELADAAPVDISVVTGDFTLPISAWYLRKMGFPIGNIICCCNENNQVWELSCNGQMHTDARKITTVVPEADITMPVNLERLIAACGSLMETEHYLQCCRDGNIYSVSDAMLQQLRQGIFVNVVSSSRIEAAIPNVYKTHNYLLSPASALAYSGLLDYRAKTGITRTAMVICDQSPICSAETIAKMMNISLDELQKLI